MKIKLNINKDFIGNLFESNMNFPASITYDNSINFESIFNKTSSDIADGKNERLAYQPEKLIGFENINLSEKSWFGIDIPVCFSSGRNNKRVIIVAMDPLRNKSINYNPKEITLNTPFTIHDIEVKNNYNDHIRKLALKYDVYITDAYKLFYRDEQNYKSMSNRDLKFCSLNVHKEILSKEIEYFKPDFILCMGNNSAKSVASIANFSLKPITTTNLSVQKKEYNYNSIPVFVIPHASGASRGSAKKFIEHHKQEYHSKTYLNDVLNIIEYYL